MATDSLPTDWLQTTLDIGDGDANSEPTDWIAATVDTEPLEYDGNSDPTEWVIAKISPEFPADEDSEPTDWITITIDAGALASGVFLVSSSGTLVPVEID